MSTSAAIETTSSVFREIYDNVPQEMKDLPQWVCWRLESNPKGGKDKKVPKNPHTRWDASSTNPKTWGTFEEACKAQDDFDLDGIMFILTENDPFVMIDLDGCIDPDTGEVAPWAKQLVERFDSYTEVSPSGTGLHILVKGKLPGKGRKTDRIEIYDQARACTMTGDLRMASDPCDRQEALDDLYCASKSVDAALKKCGDKFSLLFAGRWEEVTNTNGVLYGSQSNADLAFANMLANVGANGD